MKSKKALRSFMAVALTVMMVAVPSSVVRAEEAQNTYTVEKGDCLCRIAKKIYGNEKAWTSIYDANAGTIGKNYLLHVGQVLVIPAINSSNNPLPIQDNTVAQQNVTESVQENAAPVQPVVPSEPVVQPPVPDGPPAGWDPNGPSADWER